jgi:hypothetical protein
MCGTCKLTGALLLLVALAMMLGCCPKEQTSVQRGDDHSGLAVAACTATPTGR